MSTLLVGYDLNKPGQDYAGLIKRLKSVGTNWWHRLDSTWLIKTTMTPAELRDDLRAYIDSGDELLVIDVTGVTWAGFGFSSYKWLHDNL
ncbi:MAG TPA: hypothetical protein VH275_11255 [Solirubrobacterales bacterium]|jgi:hypothetical protein|nr:hypothetical protein [Solirubrobacterales bacterium]